MYKRVSTTLGIEDVPIAGQWRAERGFEPALARSDAERLRARWRDAVSSAKRWIPAGVAASGSTRT
jgi:hypothetical protein